MRLAMAVITAATLVALFVVARPEDDGDAAATTRATPTGPPEVQPIDPTTTAETEAEPALPEPVRMRVTIRGGRPVDGIVRAQAMQDESVLLVIRSDVADRVHVHGYDLFGDVGPGRPARMQFRASLTGRFEVELEDSHVQIAQLTVVP